MPLHSVARVEKKSLRLDDEMQFIRSWIEKPLSTGAVMPSSRVLARAMARYVDPHSQGPVIELGPGTGPVTEALVRHGVDPRRLILAEFNHSFRAAFADDRHRLAQPSLPDNACAAAGKNQD